MAIPEQFRIPDMEDIERHFQKVGVEGLATLDDDATLRIGRFVASYSFIELNLRRSVEFLHRAGLLPETYQKRPILKLPTHALVSAVKDAVLGMDPKKEDIKRTSASLDEIEYRRSIRNLFAHFAPTLMEGKDAIVFLTRSETDALQALGQPLGEDGICYAILRRSDLIGIEKHIRHYEQWIAEKASEWWKRYLA
ncbi:hypothetical protein EOA32_21400 [Mesorhizobium sp. M1A.F.Ca.ET.072.01.1.1]|uniref:hypothetical protein n=1 Tax=Mesorhizobium sp. M1A.F.Ca.ET.072.01.1.1 TaxID=2496753 RepID=UPI000FD5428E|nr:hypothetical protein [Mesorhizobium sp. M1A.F.Ca.ET.072.01.1.1]RUW49790.1 hypothetical protein EOA32_21400 [Mesorhizobium sp. M1A.F.Ca.ET.072.01.1.1]